jgi:hypothetical protein
VKDWRAIAKAHGLEAPDGELDRIVKPLEALEETFRPLVKSLRAGHEPAIVFRIGEEE